MRVLYLCHRVPYAPNRGDRIRAYHTLRHLHREGVDVHVVALAHDEEEAGKQATLAGLAARVDVVRVSRRANYLRASAGLAGSRPLTHLLLDSPEVSGRLGRACEDFRPDVVLAFCSGMARFAVERPLDGLPFVLDMVDVDSEKWRALSASTRAPVRWIYRREARLLGRFEARAARAAAATLVVNERELEAMRRLAPDAHIVVVPNGVDVDYFRPPGEDARRPEIVFAGVFDYAPNRAGAEWLLGEVWPLVRARVPDARLTFAGSGPSRALGAAAAADRQVEVTGAVDDLRPFLWRARVGAAPLFVARGLQNKVIEAFAAGLRVVTTTPVAQGLPSSLAAHCRVADDRETFADALVGELSAPPPPDLAAVLAGYTWERSLSGLVPLLNQAAAVSDRMGSTVT